MVPWDVPYEPHLATPEWLEDGRLLSLMRVPVSDSAVALCDDVMTRVIAWGRAARADGQRNGPNRGADGERKLRRAVGTVVGSLLADWASRRCSSRSLSKGGFDAGGVTSRQWEVAWKGLEAINLLHHKAGFRLFGSHDGFQWSNGRASRFWPTAALIKAAAAHGVTPESVKSDWRLDPPTVAPVVKEVIRNHTVRPHRNAQRREEIPAERLNGFAALRADVEEANTFAAGHLVNGCMPPRWRRVFHGSALLYGRWHAVGSDLTYQALSPGQRGALRIDGAQVIEIDVSGSQLTIVHGLLGLPAPDGDPYAIPGFDREVVKAFVVMTLGNGSVPKKWPKNAASKVPALASLDVSDVAASVCARYPFLGEPVMGVARRARLSELSSLGEPKRLLSLRLQNIEAEALTLAMRALRSKGCLALPVHDSLIVAASREDEARAAMVDGFRAACGATPRLKVKPEGDGLAVVTPEDAEWWA